MDFYQALLGHHLVKHLRAGGYLGTLEDGVTSSGSSDGGTPITMPSWSGLKPWQDASKQLIQKAGNEIYKGGQTVSKGFKGGPGGDGSGGPSLSSIPGIPGMPSGIPSIGSPSLGAHYTPTNYVATTPTVTGANYAGPGGMIDTGTAGVNAAQGRIGGAYDKQIGNADNSLSTLPAYQGVFKNQGALAEKQLGLSDQEAALQGQQQGLYGQQQGLADALLAQSRGQGPNPAQLQFQQNVNQNIAQQAGALASSRGINPALAAHMAAQQGAAMNQQAAGQSGVLQAQQQLAAQGQLGSQYNAMGQNLLGQGSTLGNASGIAGQAGTAYGGQGTNLGGQTSVYGTAGGLYHGAGETAGTGGSLGANVLSTGVSGLNGYNTNVVNADLGAQRITSDSQTAGSNILGNEAIGNAKVNGQIVGGLINAAGAVGAAAIRPNIPPVGVNANATAGDDTTSSDSGSPTDTLASTGGAASGADSGSGSATGGNADYGQNVQYSAHGGEILDRKALSLANALMAMGGPVPGAAKVQGDSSKNDTVPTVLSPKEIVIPRSITMADDAPKKAAEFVAKLKGKADAKSGAKGYGKILEKHRHLQKKMEELDALVRKHA